jgi:hypothetical protein
VSLYIYVYMLIFFLLGFLEYQFIMRSRRGPVQPAFHPSRNNDQQSAVNGIWLLIFWVLSNADEGTMELLDAFPLISSVAPVLIVKFGVASMSLIDLEIVI